MLEQNMYIVLWHQDEHFALSFVSTLFFSWTLGKIFGTYPDLSWDLSWELILTYPYVADKSG